MHLWNDLPYSKKESATITNWGSPDVVAGVGAAVAAFAVSGGDGAAVVLVSGAGVVVVSGAGVVVVSGAGVVVVSGAGVVLPSGLDGNSPPPSSGPGSSLSGLGKTTGLSGLPKSSI
jgi:hypothetical protein